jgi:hypothetical protein
LIRQIIVCGIIHLLDEEVRNTVCCSPQINMSFNTVIFGCVDIVIYCVALLNIYPKHCCCWN